MSQILPFQELMVQKQRTLNKEGMQARLLSPKPKKSLKLDKINLYQTFNFRKDENTSMP